FKRAFKTFRRPCRTRPPPPLPMKPPFWDRATRTLAERDHILRRLIATFPDIHLVRRGDAFTTLARAIVGQQISVKAAQTIWGRLVTATGGGGDPVRLDAVRVGRTQRRTLRRTALAERN